MDDGDELKIKYRPCKWDVRSIKCFYSQLMMMTMICESAFRLITGFGWFDVRCSCLEYIHIQSVWTILLLLFFHQCCLRHSFYSFKFKWNFSKFCLIFFLFFSYCCSFCSIIICLRLFLIGWKKFEMFVTLFCMNE